MREAVQVLLRSSGDQDGRASRVRQKKNKRPRRSAISAFELRFPIKWIVPVAAARRIFQEVQLSSADSRYFGVFPPPWSNGRLDREARGNDDGQNVGTLRET